MSHSKNIVSSIVLLVLVLTSTFIFSQKPKYWDDIQHFKKIDQENGIPKNAILFLGSSSFTKWTDVNDYFPDKKIINRGFGGSRLVDLNRYADDLLLPYHPKQIVIYCGENDIATNHPTAAEVLARFKKFFRKIRTIYPEVPIAYISIKYSPSRTQYWPEITQVNELIKSYLVTQKKTDFIDITKVMENPEGQVRDELFLDDQLHMKAEGYKLWAQVIAPYLK